MPILLEANVPIDNNWLVVEPSPLKNIVLLGWLFPMYEKNKFQTTNQIIIV